MLTDQPPVYRKIGGGRVVVILVSLEELVDEVGYYEITVTRNVLKQIITSRVTIIGSFFENLCCGGCLVINQHKKRLLKRRENEIQNNESQTGVLSFVSASR